MFFAIKFCIFLSKGETPLMLACMRNNVPRVQDIIQTEGIVFLGYTWLY